MNWFVENQTRRVVIVVAVIGVVGVSFPYFRRVYRLVKYPPDFGIKTLYKPEDRISEEGTECGIKLSDESFQIVAVHGLGAHPLYSWTKSVSKSEAERRLKDGFSKSDSKRINWLKEFLPKTFPKAHIMTFGYNAGWLINAPDKTSEESAKELLRALSSNRKGTEKLPIAFVAHSFGGIVVKDALTIARDDENYDEIYRATRGVIFLGTPHQGSQLSGLGYCIATIAMPIFGSNTALLTTLTYHDKFLETKTERFKKCTDIYICCFYETLQTYFFGCSIGRIVDRSSADLKWPQTSSISADKDHSGLNKFVSPEDPTFKDLCDEIKTSLSRPSSLTAFQKDEYLKGLPVAENASFDSDRRQSRPCLPGTRRELLDRIEKWSCDADGKYIFWLHGMAGTGKSSIARTIAGTLRSQRRLGASFFFSKGQGGLAHSGKFATTIAHELAKTASLEDKLHHLKGYICDAIARNSGRAPNSLEEQWKELVFQPLQLLKKHSPKIPALVIVIDALDECELKYIKPILAAITKAGDLETVQLRIFISSRRERTLSAKGILDYVHREVYEDCPLDSIDRKIIKRDIALFYESELKDIRKEHNLTLGWPDKQQMDKLKNNADRLFIYAETACRFLRKAPPDYLKRYLAIILEDNGAGDPDEDENKELPTSYLDNLYKTVLATSLDMFFPRFKKNAKQDMMRILGSIVVLSDPLPSTALSTLVSETEAKLDDEVRHILEPLSAVLDVPQSQHSPIQLIHPSFPDFLHNEQRSKSFFVKEESAHEDIFERCLDLMSRHLMANVCDLQRPATLASELKKDEVENYLSRAVQYACRYWVFHLERAKIVVHDDHRVHKFLRENLLHWLEALGWIGSISDGILAIRQLQSSIRANNSAKLHEFVQDANRFIVYNRSIIEQAPLQVYVSALVFAPKKSTIRKQFEKQIPGWLLRLPETDESWSIVPQTLEGHSKEVRAVTFSPDGSLVASASDDETVKLWDARSGEKLQTLVGHSKFVYAVAFSPDGSLVASASDDGTIKLWDGRSGEELQTLEGHSETINIMAFSPDGLLVASASKDGTVKLWDGRSGEELQTLDGRSKAVSAVAFSPDGSLVASASWDGTVKLWDARSGEKRQTLYGHSKVSAVAFSQDGSLVASASWDGTVELWDARSGEKRQTLKGHSKSVTAVAVSPDGSLVASASDDGTIKLWDGRSGEDRQTLKGHSKSVTAVAFSPDGSLVASASDDETVKLWDARSGEDRQTRKGHSEAVSAVTFSPDGSLVASASTDGIVKLWDTRSGEERQMLYGHSKEVRAVAFSPGGSLVASASWYGSVKLWDTHSGEKRQTLIGHSKVSAMAFSPDGSLVASASWDGAVELWDSRSGEKRQTLDGNSKAVSAVAVSPDGSLVASASWDGTVELWDARSGEKRQTLDGHSKSVTAVAFSPDESLVASASWDGTIKLWDARSGEKRQTLEVDAVVQELSFTSDGSYLHTDRGFLDVISSAASSGLTRPVLSSGLFVKEQWVARGTENLLWLPPDYRARSVPSSRTISVAIFGDIVALGHASGCVSILEFGPPPHPPPLRVRSSPFLQPLSDGTDIHSYPTDRLGRGPSSTKERGRMLGEL